MNKLRPHVLKLKVSAKIGNVTVEIDPKLRGNMNVSVGPSFSSQEDTAEVSMGVERESAPPRPLEHVNSTS